MTDIEVRPWNLVAHMNIYQVPFLDTVIALYMIAVDRSLPRLLSLPISIKTAKVSGSTSEWNISITETENDRD